jgi:hypothetical protein
MRILAEDYALSHLALGWKIIDNLVVERSYLELAVTDFFAS